MNLLVIFFKIYEQNIKWNRSHVHITLIDALGIGLNEKNLDE